MPDVFTVLGEDHAEVKQMLNELESGLTRAGGASAPQLRERKKLVQRLIIAESKHEAVELGVQLMRGKDLAPTRPHPEIPPRPGILKAGGPAVAAADRLRDTIEGRGKK